MGSAVIVFAGLGVLLVVAVITYLLTMGASPTKRIFSSVRDIEYKGESLRYIKGDAGICSKSCLEDSDCVAFNYTIIDKEGDTGCWLLSSITGKTQLLGSTGVALPEYAKIV